MAISSQEQARKLKERIEKQLARSMGRGIEALRVFLTNRIREELSIRAPRKMVTGQQGERYYVATAPAVHLAPPRIVSGRLRQTFTSRVENGNTIVFGANARGRPPGNFGYPEYHEVRMPGRPGSGQHQYVQPVIARYRRQINQIMGFV